MIFENINTELKLVNAVSHKSTSKQFIITVNNFIVPVLGVSLNMFTHIFVIIFKFKVKLMLELEILTKKNISQQKNN